MSLHGASPSSLFQFMFPSFQPPVQRRGWVPLGRVEPGVAKCVQVALDDELALYSGVVALGKDLVHPVQQSLRENPANFSIALHCFALGLEGLAVPKVSLQGAASQRQVPLLERATQDRHGRQKAFLNHRSCGAFAFCRHTILL